MLLSSDSNKTITDSVPQTLYPPEFLPFKHAFVDGWVYPPFITEAIIRKSQAFPLRTSDVFVATYPKCGTTWTQNIITKLHEKHETGVFDGLGEHLLEKIPWLENFDHNKMEERASPRYMKTHNPYIHLAKNPEVACKYVMVCRNPKDACVSLYHHAKGFSVFNYSGDFEQFAELFLEGKVESGCWWSHLKQYYENKDELKTYFMKYEDLHAKGPELIKGLNEFLELPALTLVECEDIKEATSFKKQKTDPSANYSWRDSSRKKDESPFMRKGTVGDWKNYFTKDLSERFNEKTRKVLEKSNSGRSSSRVMLANLAFSHKLHVAERSRHHAKGFSVFNYSGDFEQFAELFLEGKVESGCWWSHLKQYYENTEELKTYFMKYEDLHTKGPELIKGLNEFLELPALTLVECEDIKEATSFKKQKTDPSANYSWRDSSRKKDESPFMRKGTVGDWKNYFTKDLSERFNEKTRKVLAILIEIFLPSLQFSYKAKIVSD
eukprot:sb/3464141/